MLKAHVKLVFTEPLLGSAPLNKDVYRDFIESRKHERANVVTDVETETLPEVDEDTGWTGFHQDENGIFLYDYVVKGFMKEAANTLKETLHEKALRSKLDNYLFVTPRRIHPVDKDGKLIVSAKAILERPLRAQTMRGPRVTLARSNYIEAGSSIEFDMTLIDGHPLKQPEEVIEQCLKYGALKGLGQWRNGGYGRFTHELKFV